ncbi:uncharacterized protein LOC143917740 [Arctopsyche grandis]|uniref:uncharacterized protein LOC143917740 n=1 Tax=Arctopsyche grandis TaxID=121162 RepID=UPI00406D7B74
MWTNSLCFSSDSFAPLRWQLDSICQLLLIVYNGREQINGLGTDAMSTASGAEGDATSGLNSFPCRLCLRLRLHNTDASQGRLRALLHTLFSFWINPHDKSKVVCIECLNTVMTFYDFYKKVQRVQEKFCNTSIDDISDSEMENPDRKENKLEVPICKKEDWTEYNSLFISCDKMDETSNSETSTNSKNQNKNLSAVKEEPVDFYDEGIGNNSDFHSVSLKEEYMSSDDADDIANSEKCHSPSDKTSHCGSNSSISDSPKSNKHSRGSSPLKSDSVNTYQEDNVSKSIAYSFPSEIYKNGKLVLKGNALESVIGKFYDLDCNICKVNRKFTELNYLFRHYESEHHTKGYVVCCNSKLYNRKAICMHMGRHLQPSAFECPICKKLVSRPYVLDTHIQSHLPDSEKPCKCDQCDKRFGNIAALNHHKKIHIPISQRDTYYCNICGKVFTLSASLRTHMTCIHGGVKHLCSECGRSFQTKTNLTVHMLTHDPLEKNKAKCPQCGLICANVYALRRHMKRHTDLLQCSLCSFAAPLPRELRLHMHMKHSDSKPHSCKICGKTFKRKCGLTTHMAQHTGERKFICPFCPKTFASSGNYYTHRKRMHSEELKNRIKAIEINSL